MGAPVGNTNAAKSRPWAAAIKRALEKRSRFAQMEALDELAEKLLAQCDAGDMTALKELGDRLDGKPTQAVEHAGNGGGSIGITTSGTIDHRVLPATAEFIGAMLRAGADPSPAQPDADGSVLSASVRTEADGS